MVMKATIAALALLITGWAGTALADPDKDESGKGRERGAYATAYSGVPGFGPEEEDLLRNDGYERPRRERRAEREFKEEYDDGNCKYERKMEKSGEYKEEVKCR